MTEDQFWQIIQRACQSDSRSSEHWHARLVAELTKLSADGIIQLQQHLPQLCAFYSQGGL